MVLMPSFGLASGVVIQAGGGRGDAGRHAQDEQRGGRRMPPDPLRAALPGRCPPGRIGWSAEVSAQVVGQLAAALA